jgi:hypothetical protein
MQQDHNQAMIQVLVLGMKSSQDVKVPSGYKVEDWGITVF